VKKTNAARILDRLGIRYELRSYEVDPEDLSAESVAEKIGMPPEHVFKTLVVRGDRNGICLAVIPASATLDLSLLASASGDKKMALVPVAQIQDLTGYIRGGVTALGCKHDYRVYTDRTMEGVEIISVSAGTRGMQLILKPQDYLRAVNAAVAEISRPAD
jgi:Cys-tRNA(Pro)/Cys-tRNA(Cys) deacylase